MIPPLIVDAALELGIDIIAITDHNSSANIIAVQQAAENTSLTVLPGMEIQTREDVHSLCLFDTLDQIENFQKLINATLPDIKNQAEHFGMQFVVDKTGDFIREEKQLLITSSSFSLDEAWKIVTDMGGLFIPAHINRKSYGLIESLGFIPPDIPFEAVEISRHISPLQARELIPSIGHIPILQNGDAHRLTELLGTLCFQLESPNITEIKMAIRESNGRSFEILR
jgi:hypothetical protein